MLSFHHRTARLFAVVLAAVNILAAVTVLAVHARAETPDGIKSATTRTAGLVRPAEIRETQAGGRATLQFAQLADAASIPSRPTARQIPLPQTAAPAGEMFFTGLLLTFVGLLTGLAWLLWPRFMERDRRNGHHLTPDWRA